MVSELFKRIVGSAPAPREPMTIRFVSPEDKPEVIQIPVMDTNGAIVSYTTMSVDTAEIRTVCPARWRNESPVRSLGFQRARLY